MTASTDAGQHDSLFQTDFPPEEFAARRAKVFDAIGPGAGEYKQIPFRRCVIGLRDRVYSYR